MRGRRVVRWTGLALVAVGLVLLGYVGWQLWGTTWQSQREQRDVVAATERAWRADQGGDATPAEQAAGVPDGVIALVRIPAFGDDYVVPAWEGTSDEVLGKGFGVFDTSPAPGGVGNFALAGHRITHGEPLRDMPDLEAGDIVEVDTATTTYTYELDTGGADLTVGFEDGWVTAADPQRPGGTDVATEVGSKRLLTLVTCSELFHTDNRLVAFGHLVDQRPREG